jgi:putative MATE family efflux protein
VVLALPLVATSLNGVVFQLTDLTFVSRLGERATTAVVVSNQSLRQIFFMLLIGASFGAQGLISRCVGGGDGERAGRVAGQIVLLGLGFSALMAVVGVTFAKPLLAMMNVSPAVLELGVPYVRLVFLLNVGFVVVFLSSAILNGAGDSTTPLLISLAQTAFGLLGEWCLIFGHLGLPALGIQGVALGIAVGQVVAVAAYLRVLFRGRGRIELRRRHLVPDGRVMREILRLAWPPAVQLLGGFLVTVIFIRLVGSFGEKAQAAYAIGLRLSMLGPMLAVPIAGACATLVGQNLGARDVPRAWRALGVGMVAGVAVLWTIAAGVYLYRTEIIAAFASDPEVIRIGAELLLYQAATFGVWAFYFPWFRALQGAGDVAVPMLISLANSLLVTLPLGFWLSTEWGLGRGVSGVFMASLCGSAIVTTLTGLWVATGHWTRAAPWRAAPDPVAHDG